MLVPFLAAALAIAAPPTASAQMAQSTLRLGIDTTNLDRSIRPQDDFFGFVNGTWIKKTEIPADQSSYGAFVELREGSEAALKAIVDEVSKAKAPAGSERQKVRDLYLSFMDSARIEARGIAPLTGELEAIAALKSTADLPAALARLARIGVQGPFGAFVGQDQKNSSAYIVSVSQSGLGMPDRDYYLRSGERFDETRQAYADYVERILTLAGHADAAGAADRIIALERAIAEKHWDRVRNRDRDATYNKKTVAELGALTPGFDWAKYLPAAGLGKATEVVVRQPDYFEAMNGLIAETPLATWRDYLSYKLVSGFADELSSDFVAARFAFYGRALGGQQEQRPRWKRGISQVEGALGEALGRLYVERHFKPEAKARMDELVKNLRAAFRQGIEELEWMGPDTKAQAQDKLAKFTVKIGYPDKWRDYSSLAIKPDDLLGNAMRANMFRYEDMANRLGQPVDRTRWGMTPQTVNAYYNSTNNEIVFPAGILQPPFFDVAADDAVNYGAIGGVIGHEISHGFDDQGSKSDGDGNLRNWFTPEDLEAFRSLTTRLSDQFGAYVAIDTLRINGRLTLGENIGDLSGLAVAYRAYRMSLGGKEAPVIGGFTGDQRFFMGWAQVWRTKMRDEAMRRQLLTNSHSPGMYRAFVPLTNIDAFYAAFGVKPGDGMYRAPEERVRIW